MVDKSRTRVADVLAAARKSDSKGQAPAKGKEGEGVSTESAPTPAAEMKEDEPLVPAPSAKEPAAGGGRPSVAEILAMARGGQHGGTVAVAPKERPAAKSAAASPKSEAPAKSVPLQTQSILAAVRKGAKPGPMTKAQAAATVAAPAGDVKKAKAREAIFVPPLPSKPDYAKPASEQAVGSDVAERRAFLFGLSALAVGFAALAATMTAWVLGSVRFMFPNILREPPSRFTVGFPDQFPSGQVETKFTTQYGVWIVNTEYNGQQEIFALKSVCTHLGCTPNWLEAEQKFKCPCHGSGFYKDGINFEGPAPRPLERYAISIANDGKIEVDKSRTFQEELGQWADPSCYIPV